MVLQAAACFFIENRYTVFVLKNRMRPPSLKLRKGVNFVPKFTGWYQSSQMDRAVNAVAYAFRGANPFQPT